MNLKVDKQPKNTYKVLITIPKKEIKDAFEHALEHESKELVVPGFRKGKVPPKIAKEKIDKTKVRSHALNHLLTDAYIRAIKENKLMPIVSPLFDIEVFEEDQDAKITMTIIEKPVITLGDYTKGLETLGKKKGRENKKETPVVVTHQEVVDTILKTGNVEVPDELIEEEVNRMMSSLIDRTAKLGITMDQYLESIKKKPDELRSEYTKTATSTLKADFMITEIARDKGIQVSDEEVNATIESIPDEKSREALRDPNQKMYVKAVLLKNKTLQVLADIASSKASENKSNKSKKDSTDNEKQNTKKTTKKKESDAKKESK